MEGGPAPAAARLPPRRPGGRTQSLTGACFPLPPRPQRPDPHHHLAAPSHRGARQLRPHDPLRWVPGGGGPRPALAPRTVNGRSAPPHHRPPPPPRPVRRPGPRAKFSPLLPRFLSLSSPPRLHCRPAPRMGGGLLGGGRQLLHRVSTALPCPALPRTAGGRPLAARPRPARGVASGGSGRVGVCVREGAPDRFRPLPPTRHVR